MKIRLNQCVIGFALVLGSLFAGTASAETVFGKITFLGTLPEEFDGTAYHARFRIRVSESTCGSDSAPKDRWIHVRSSNTEPIVRVIAEAPLVEDAKRLCTEVGQLIR